MEKYSLFFEGRDGVKWYRCKNCGYITRGKPQVCPVCRDKKIVRENDKK